MALRPKIRNSDGTLTDIPLEAAQAVKLKNSHSIGILGLDAESASFNGTSSVKIKVTGVPATLLTGTASIDTTGNAATSDEATHAGRADYASSASMLTSEWTSFTRLTYLPYGTYLIMVIIDDQTSQAGGEGSSFTDLITVNSDVYKGLNNETRYSTEYVSGAIHIHSANSHESPWFKTTRLKYYNMSSTQFRVELFVSSSGTYALTSSAINGAILFPNTAASSLANFNYQMYYKRIM